MNEKKLVASVVLGIALVSLITALVVALFDSFVLFIDFSNSYGYIIGAFMLVAVALGVAFLTVFFTKKEKRVKLNFIMAIVFVSYCFVTIIVSRLLLLELPYSHERYTSYLAAAITLAVSTALVFSSWYYLTFIKKKEEQTQMNQQESAEISADDK